MIAIPGNVRIFLYQDYVDMRKGFEGLSALAEKVCHQGLFTGALFVFVNRCGDRMKVLYWDHDGLVIWNKRLEHGTFARTEQTKILLTRREFIMLLEGIKPKRLNRRWNIS